MYVIEEDGEVHAVFYFFIGPDETYQVIQDGAWLSDAPYGTIHQVASDGKVRRRSAIRRWSLRRR